jgi:hypothetical protein
MGVEAGPGCPGDGGEQRRVLGLEPGQRLRLAGQGLRRRPRLRRRQGELVADRDEDPGGADRGVPFVVERPPRGGAALVFPAAGPRLLAGVGAEQVVERKPARQVLGEQVGAGQLTEHLVGLAGRDPARLAAGGAEMSGPGCTPSSRNIRAAMAPRWQSDQENTDRMSVTASPASRMSRRRRASRNCAARSASGRAGSVAARAAAMFSAKGSRAHSPIRACAARGPAARRRACGSAARGPRPW